jgi:hypothetical protein
MKNKKIPHCRNISKSNRKIVERDKVSKILEYAFPWIVHFPFDFDSITLRVVLILK